MGLPTRSEENLATFKNSHPATSMARFSARRSPCQNSHDGKDKLASGTPTKDSNRCIYAPATTRAPILAVAPIVAPLIAFGSADSFMVGYLEDELQRIVKTILGAKPLTLLAFSSVPAPVVAAAPHYKGP